MMQMDLFGKHVDVTKKPRDKLAHLAMPLLEAHDYQCYLCKEEITPRECWVDHVIPVKHGGSNDWGNLRPTHWYCNLAKRTRMPDDPNLQAVIDAIPAKIKDALTHNNCLACGEEIKDRTWQAMFCGKCVDEHRKASMRQWHRENKDKFYPYRRQWRIRNRERVRAQGRSKYHSDPEYRARRIATSTEWTKKNSDKVKAYREKHKARKSERQKERYATDPEYRAKMIARSKARYEKNKAKNKP